MTVRDSLDCDDQQHYSIGLWGVRDTYMHSTVTSVASGCQTLESEEEQ